MGISGLHACIKPYLRPTHVSKLRGHRIGVDAWSWLHRGAVGAARELATGERPWEQRGYAPPWVEFCLKMVALLRSAGTTPVLVFDGCRLPAKAGTNQQRRQRRSEARERATKLLQEGREQEAQSVFMQCIDVTADMAHEVIVKLRERGVEFVVAPYEADAQLAYLTSIPEQDGGVAAVITEDSDLVAYGCRTIIFKLDTSGHGLELSMDRLFSGPEAAAAASGGGSTGTSGRSSSGGGGSGGSGGSGGGGVVSFRGWSLDMLQAACVLAGCDFLPSLKGISFKTAHVFVARRRSLAATLKALRTEKRFRLAATPDYCAAAERALLAFKHALVFCPNTAGGSCRRLTPWAPPQPGSQQQQQHTHLQGEQEEQEEEEEEEEGKGEQQGGQEGCDASQGDALAHLGAELAVDVARGIAYGELHPHTLQPFAAAAAAAGGGGMQHGGQHAQHAQHVQRSQHAQHMQQQQHHHHHHPSLSSRRQLGSWMAAAAGAGSGGGGGGGRQVSRLGPAQHVAQHPVPPPQQHRHAAQLGQQRRGQQQQAQQQPLHGGEHKQQGADISDVLQLYQLPGQHPQQHPQQRVPGGGTAAEPAAARQPSHNPFARCQRLAQATAAAQHAGGAPSAPPPQGGSSAGACLAAQAAVTAAAAAAAESGGGGSVHPPAGTEAEAGGDGSEGGSFRSSLRDAETQAAVTQAAAASSASQWALQPAGQPQQQQHHQQQQQRGPHVINMCSSSSSWHDSATEGPSGCGSSAPASQQEQQRQAMQAITNQRLPASQHQQSQHQQNDHQQNYHQHQHQHHHAAAAPPPPPLLPLHQGPPLRSTPPPGWAAAASIKRKSSGGGSSSGSSSGSGKKAARVLAPPSQRISRFFPQLPKKQ